MDTKILRNVTRLHAAMVFPRRIIRLAEGIARLLPPDARVLDVGAGSGDLAKLLLELRPDLSIEGIDVLVRPDTAIPVTRFDGLDIPFGDGAFDAITIVDVLHHAESAERLLAEVARVAPGCIVVKDHYRNGLAANATLRFMDWVGNRGHGVVLPYRYLARQEWLDLFARLRLEADVVETRLQLYPWPATWLFDRSLHFLARLHRSAR